MFEIVIAVVIIVVIVFVVLVALSQSQPPKPLGGSISQEYSKVVMSFSPDVVARVEKHLLSGRKIQAIKVIREEARMGLKEAKDIVDNWAILLSSFMRDKTGMVGDRNLEIPIKTKKQLEFEKKKKELISSANYKYLANFVKRYSGMLFSDISEEIGKLKDLLEKKGFQFDDEEIKQLIVNETKTQEYVNFKAKIMYQKPKKLEDYISNLIEIYGENFQKYLPLLGILLSENKILFDEEQIWDKVEKIKKQIEIAHFEKKLNSDTLHFISIDDLDLITGYEFEHFLKTLFEKMGYKVEHTKLSGDQGGDLMANKFGEKLVIQAKRCINKVNNKAIQEVVAAIKHYKVDRGMVITTSEFTPSAIQLANSNNIELIDRHKLEKLIRKYL